MHWTGIAWAHDGGYRHYDFEGIPVEVAQEVRDGNPANARGVAFFKLGFGGDAVVYPGTYDLLPGRLPDPCSATSFRGPNVARCRPRPIRTRS